MSSNCPKCQGDEWKSARLLILEGTTKSEGALEGELVSKGSLSIDPRNFFLADRWFSFENPISAEISSTTTTVLVDEIKKLLVSEASIRPVPIPPKEPVKLLPPKAPVLATPLVKNYFARDPAKTKLPSKPEEPANPVDKVPEFKPHSWFYNYRKIFFYFNIF